MKPLTNVQPDDVQRQTKYQTAKGKQNEIAAVVGQALPSLSAYEQRVGRGKIENAWVVGKIRRPIQESRHETGKFSECALAPDVDPTFFGIPGRQLENAKHQRDEIRETTRDPDDDRAWTCCGCRRDPP